MHSFTPRTWTVAAKREYFDKQLNKKTYTVNPKKRVQQVHLILQTPLTLLTSFCWPHGAFKDQRKGLRLSHRPVTWVSFRWKRSQCQVKDQSLLTNSSKLSSTSVSNDITPNHFSSLVNSHAYCFMFDNSVVAKFGKSGALRPNTHLWKKLIEAQLWKNLIKWKPIFNNWEEKHDYLNVHKCPRTYI